MPGSSGSQIRARAWELLLAMLVMEAAFLAWPAWSPRSIYHAWLKGELQAADLV